MWPFSCFGSYADELTDGIGNMTIFPAALTIVPGGKLLVMTGPLPAGNNTL